MRVGEGVGESERERDVRKRMRFLSLIHLFVAQKSSVCINRYPVSNAAIIFYCTVLLHCTVGVLYSLPLSRLS